MCGVGGGSYHDILGSGSQNYDWRTFHVALIELINGNFASRRLRLVCEFVRHLAFGLEVRRLAPVLREALDANDAVGEINGMKLDTGIEVSLHPFCAPTPAVQAMADWLDRYLADDLYAAILHGSLGTGEVVNYSDFDALVIIRNAVFEDASRLARVAKRLFEARRFMYEQDPLQHHGWFVVPEVALLDWPEDYLPVAVLKRSSRLGSCGVDRLWVRPTEDRERMQKGFEELAGAVKQDLETGQYLRNLYRFKSLLSKAMLLPALYVQARDGHGVFKSNSFDLARRDFDAATWGIMDRISAIRRDWPVVVPPSLPAVMWYRPGFLGEKLRRRFAPAIPQNLKSRFSASERESLENLVLQMEQGLNVVITDRLGDGAA
jgi:predicted nucleotidyltransferase